MGRRWIRREKGNILQDGSTFGWMIHGNKLPEEFSVPECLTARPINSDEVLVKNWHTSLTMLVLSHFFG